MKWTWRIARLAGIDIYIHATFLLLIYIVGISYWNQHGTLVAAGVYGCREYFAIAPEIKLAEGTEPCHLANVRVENTDRRLPV
jgi:hypothetical protein